MAEFTLNNNHFLSIRFFVFFILKDLHLFISFHVVDLSNSIIYKQINKIKAIDIFEAI